MLTPIIYVAWRYWGYPSVLNNFRTGLWKFCKVRSSGFLSFLTQPFEKVGSGTCFVPVPFCDPLWVLIFWLRLGSSLFVPSFPPLLGALVGLIEFLRVSSFWELIMKPLSSVSSTSHLCMLTKIQNPSVTRIHCMQVVFRHVIPKLSSQRLYASCLPTRYDYQQARAYVVEWSNNGGNQDQWFF